MTRKLGRKLGPATTTVVALLVTASLALPEIAFAHTLSMNRARSEALEAGRKLGTQTGSYKTRLSGCHRRSSHRIDCEVENLYHNGSASCSTDIEVRYVSARTSRIRTTARETLCF
jgi:hypothetical protein